MPGVAECAVVGVPDERWGEAVALAVVLRDGAALDPAALELALAPIAAFKHPRAVVVVPHLPKTVLGKVRRAALAASIAGASAAVLRPG